VADLGDIERGESARGESRSVEARGTERLCGLFVTLSSSSSSVRGSGGGEKGGGAALRGGEGGGSTGGEGMRDTWRGEEGEKILEVSRTLSSRGTKKDCFSSMG